MDFKLKTPGLYARQSTISGLHAPKWVTIYISEITHLTQRVTNFSLGQQFMWLLSRLVEGIAVTGAHGCSIVIGDTAATSTEMKNTHDFLEMCFGKSSAIMKARPHFRVIATSVASIDGTASEQYDADTVIAGPVIAIVTEGFDHKKFPSFLNANLSQVIFFEDMFVVTTSSIKSALHRKSLYPRESAARRPHWNDRSSKEILIGLTSMISVNILCKPKRFTSHKIYSVAEFADTMTSQIIDERGILEAKNEREFAAVTRHLRAKEAAARKQAAERAVASPKN